MVWCCSFKKELVFLHLYHHHNTATGSNSLQHYYGALLASFTISPATLSRGGRPTGDYLRVGLPMVYPTDDYSVGSSPNGGHSTGGYYTDEYFIGGIPIVRGCSICGYHTGGYFVGGYPVGGHTTRRAEPVGGYLIESHCIGGYSMRGHPVGVHPIVDYPIEDYQ